MSNVELGEVGDLDRPDIGLDERSAWVRGLPDVGKPRIDLDPSRDGVGLIRGDGSGQRPASGEDFQHPERRRQAATAEDRRRPSGGCDPQALMPSRDLDLGEVRQRSEVGLVGDVDDGA